MSSREIEARVINSEGQEIGERSIPSSPLRNELPEIEVIDYDCVISTATSKTWKNRHACPKCASEQLLQLQLDPFHTLRREPQKIRGNCVESGSLVDLRRSQSTKHDPRFESGLISTRRARSFAETLQTENARNGGPLRQAVEPRKETTLRRHYYPEGGWGYVIVTCSTLVHILGIGLQLSAPGSWHVSAELKFHHPPLHSAGKKLFRSHFSNA